MKKSFLLLCFIFMHVAMGSSPKHRVLVIGTGGTIAGVAVSGDPQHYDPGKLTVQAILTAIPEINDFFTVDGTQMVDSTQISATNPHGYVSVASSYILERQWIELARQVNQALADDYEAVFVLHGTDTLEETAFFLQLTVHSTKPVFIVGAMRPAQGTNQPDGPDNLRSAFRLALDPKSAGKGVIAVMNFRAYSAYDLMKARAFPANIADANGVSLPSDQLPSAFIAPNYGNVARIEKNFLKFNDWHIAWNDANPLFQTTALGIKFDLPVGLSLPQVPIIYQQIGNDSAELLRNYYLNQTNKIKSYVLVGSGACSLTKDIGALITSLAPDPDILFMRAGHVPTNWCQFTQDDTNPNTTGAATLSPQQAKILLQLLQAAIDSGADLGPLVAQQSGFRDKARAYLSQHLPYPYHIGSFEPIHDDPPATAAKNNRL